MVNRIHWQALAIALFASLTPIAGAAPDPAAVYGALPTIGDARLSPDGSQLLTLVALEGTYQVGIRDLRTAESQALLSTDGVEFRYQWCAFASAERVVCSLRQPGEIVPGSGSPFLRYRERRVVREHLVAVDVDGSDVLQLVPRAVTRVGGDLEWNAVDQDEVIAWLPGEPDAVLVQLAREDRVWPSVYRLDIRTNRLRRVHGHRSGVLRWLATPDGRIRAGLGLRDDAPFAVVVDEDGATEPLDLAGLGLEEIPTRFGLDADGDRIWFLAHLGAEHVGLHYFDLASRRLLEDDRIALHADITGVVTDQSAKTPLGVRVEDPVPRTIWLDAALRSRLDLAAAFDEPGLRLSLVHADAARERFLLRLASTRRAPGLWLFEPGASRLARIAPDLPAVDTVLPTEHLHYTARDGLEIPAWLTLPGPRDDGPWPTVLLPHGGPWGHDSGGFDYWAQFLARRGVAVLQPNYRGSTGQGRTLLEAGDAEWGRGMQDDLLDGLDHLVAEGIADPDRVCVVGGSYGGFAALLAAFRDAGRIRCAVSYAGVSDLDALEDYWRSFRFGGVSAPRLPPRAARQELSPLANADRIAIPLLVLHGAEDRVVKVEHSRRLVEALGAAGVAVRYVEQPHGDHHLMREADRVEFLRELDAFLGRHLLADGAD